MMMRVSWRGFALIWAVLAGSVNAADDRTVVFDIAAQPIDDAVLAFGQQANLTVVLAQDIVGRDIAANAVVGTYEPLQALGAMLKGTPLAYRQVAVDAVVVGEAVTAPSAGVGGPHDVGKPGTQNRVPVK